MHVLAAAVRAADIGLLHLRYVVLLRKFLVAICAMESVLRHAISPANIIPPIFLEGCEFGQGYGEI
jgi:hypothetical protein